MPILQINNISKKFDGLKAIDNISFELDKHTITALIGPNGAGKTTTFNIITGFLPSDSGEIIFKGIQTNKISPFRISKLGIGRTFQNIKLFSQMTVLDNILIAMDYGRHESLFSALIQNRVMRIIDNDYKQKAIEYLKLVDLDNKKYELAGDLSFGQRKLIEIVRALALTPDLLLLDEPTAGLSPEMVQNIKQIIHRIHESGVTILFIEHDLKVVMDISEKVIVLNHGKKIAEGTPNEIQSSKIVIDAYLGKRK
jgi:ABC-type branched-subunit amino acid transport system ATPase component